MDNYEWIDWPSEGYFGAKWGWEHTIGCGFATFLYIIPGIIFLIIKPIYRQRYLDAEKQAEANHQIAFDKTKCIFLFSALHLGGHPKLPYNERVLIGLKSTGVVEFYTYKLKRLHSAPFDVVATAVRTIQHVSGTPSYVSTTNEHTLRWGENIQGKVFEAEFNMRPYTPQQFVQRFNELQVS